MLTQVDRRGQTSDQDLADAEHSKGQPHPFTAIILLHVHDAVDICLVVTMPLSISRTHGQYIIMHIFP